MVLDWYQEGNIPADATLTDWEGATSGTNRGIKGGCASQSTGGGLTLTGRASTGDIFPNRCAAATGFRVCLTEK